MSRHLTIFKTGKKARLYFVRTGSSKPTDNSVESKSEGACASHITTLMSDLKDNKEADLTDLGTLESGPRQPKLASYPKTQDGKQSRCFSSNHYGTYPWLEYSSASHQQSTTGKKILIVLTSADNIPGAEKETGWFLPELALPYKVLVDAGFTEFDCVSPKGGKAPLDANGVEMFKDDPACQWFLNDAKAQALVNNTKTPNQIKASEYAAVLYPGGHGPIFDLATNEDIAKITAEVYEKGGVVAAICHGPAGLVPVKLANGDSIVKGKTVTCFSNAEEDAVDLSKYMPFMLETRLEELGAKFCKADMWQENVAVDGKLITGQNPASSTKLGKSIVELLK